jgi:hypothetical protein
MKNNNMVGISLYATLVTLMIVDSNVRFPHHFNF